MNWILTDLDDTLERLLLLDKGLGENRIEITFNQPKREWSARLNRPTINLYLYDVRENSKLRQTQPAWETIPHKDDHSKIVRQRRPVRIDVYYMVTIWAADVEDEHRLLSAVLMVLFRNPELPEDVLLGLLQDQPVPITLKVAQEDTLQEPADIWSALDNEMRPSIPVVVTLALNPYAPSPPIKLVRERGLRPGPGLEWLFRERAEDEIERNAHQYRWSVGGSVQSKKPLEQLRLKLVEGGQVVSLQSDGRFVIGNLAAGQYNLEITAPGRKARRYPLAVPGPDYEFKF